MHYLDSYFSRYVDDDIIYHSIQDCWGGPMHHFWVENDDGDLVKIVSYGPLNASDFMNSLDRLGFDEYGWY